MKIIVKDKNKIILKDITDCIEGFNLYNIIIENKFLYTLEIGFAMGLSAIWITQAHKNLNISGKHYAIDPNQKSVYLNIGRTLVNRCGLGKYLSVIEQPSYIALPKLLEQIIKNKIPKFHLIYIDGWHTFDYTLVDFFYADLILEINGIIILDDIKHEAVSKAFNFIVKNYPHYQTLYKTDKSKTQGIFIKKSNDTREWNHYVNF
jgi:predicted O-methyltransferase YrrM